MELTWTDSPDTGSVFFTRDVYDKFSLAPNIKELWSILHSPKVKAESKEEAEKDQKPSPPGPSSELSGSEDTSGVDNDHDSDESPQVKQNSLKKRSGGSGDGKVVVSEQKFPEPRIPYPRFSAVKKQDHNKYMHWLLNPSLKPPPQLVVQKIRQEVSEFMGYLQDVSRACTEDYNYISQGAAQYCEEYLKAFFDHLRSYPQYYVLQETTSLLGNVYMPNLTLKLEKQLLAMGSVDVGANRILCRNAQLSVDYDCVNAAFASSKKAREAHKAISSDATMERLSSKYEPDVCMAREALLRILDQNAEFTEDWEVPVWVKVNSLTGKKTVYIEPPLLKRELTVREKNHLFHEESIKLSFQKKDSKPVFFLMTVQTVQLSPEKTPEPKEGHSRKLVAAESTDMDFEVDFTELESFGESTLPSLKKTNQDAAQKTEAVRKPSAAEAKLPPKAGSDCQDGDADSSWTDIEDNPAKESGDTDLEAQLEQGSGHSSTTEKQEEESTEFASPAKRTRKASDCSADSDESRLFIDDIPSPRPDSQAAKKLSNPATSRAAASTVAASSTFTRPTPSAPLSPQAAASAKRGVKRPRLEGQCDQLGQILRMQSAMLKPTSSTSTSPSSRTQKTRPTPGPAETPVHSLVKSSVSSFLEGKEREDGVTHTGPTVTVQLNNRQKNLLRTDLQSCVEDEGDFEAPQEGNVLYKLYSLHDLLVLVRSSIPIGHSRTSATGNHCVVPVCVLPKLEYQLSYGAECVTSSEACRLWADTLLNPSTVSYIARINAHTSKLVELQELRSGWMQSISCDFQPARSLNILHHVLKKVTGLPEGRYLLSHRSRMPHFNILKACEVVASGRSPYDLQASYVQTQAARTPSTVPWVPVDHSHLLIFHKRNRRIPCTFPPQEPIRPQQGMTAHRFPNQNPKFSKAQRRRRKRKKGAKLQKLKQAGSEGDRAGQQHNSNQTAAHTKRKKPVQT